MATPHLASGSLQVGRQRPQRNESANSCSLFGSFPFLPTEIRLKIWRYACWDSRAHSLFCLPHLNIDPSKRYPISALPATLFVNRESRSESHKVYDLFWTSPARSRPRGLDDHDNLVTNCFSPTQDLFQIRGRLATEKWYKEVVQPMGILVTQIRRLELSGLVLKECQSYRLSTDRFRESDVVGL